MIENKKPIVVTLDTDEMMEAWNAAGERTVENIKLGRKDKKGTDTTRAYQISIEGLFGERAFAKGTGLPFLGKGTFRGNDVGEFEVRTTPYESGRLLLKKDDDPKKIAWLVTGKDDTYVIRGWVLIGLFQDETKYWGTVDGKRWQFVVPREALSLDLSVLNSKTFMECR